MLDLKVPALRVTTMSWVLLVWSCGRIIRGVMLWGFYIDASWSTQIDFDKVGSPVGAPGFHSG